MKKGLKFLCVLALLLTFIMPINVKANALVQSNLNSYETLGKNAIKRMTKIRGNQWNEIETVNIREIFDFADKSIGYCIDFNNKETDEKAYIILSSNIEDELISEFAIGKYSPYTEKQVPEDSKCIYDGALSYYSKYTVNQFKNTKDSSIYVDIKMDKDLEKNEIDLLKKNAKNKIYRSTNPSKSKKIREAVYLNNDINTINNSTTESAISYRRPIDPVYQVLTVPDYQWYRGCSPTAAAMVLKHRYPQSLPDEKDLIDELANAMGTESSGATSISDIPKGIRTVLKNHKFAVDTWNDGSGKSNSTFSEFCTEIDDNKPLVATLIGSKLTAPSYPNGFKNHSMTGVGYQYENDSDGIHDRYIIVHDTGVDGDVNCNFDSSSLGTNTWTYVH